MWPSEISTNRFHVKSEWHAQFLHCGISTVIFPIRLPTSVLKANVWVYCWLMQRAINFLTLICKYKSELPFNLKWIEGVFPCMKPIFINFVHRPADTLVQIYFSTLSEPLQNQQFDIWLMHAGRLRKVIKKCGFNYQLF